MIELNPKPFFCITENVHASPGRSAAGESGLQTAGQNTFPTKGGKEMKKKIWFGYYLPFWRE